MFGGFEEEVVSDIVGAGQSIFGGFYAGLRRTFCQVFVQQAGGCAGELAVGVDHVGDRFAPLFGFYTVYDAACHGELVLIAVIASLHRDAGCHQVDLICGGGDHIGRCRRGSVSGCAQRCGLFLCVDSGSRNRADGGILTGNIAVCVGGELNLCPAVRFT